MSNRTMLATLALGAAVAFAGPAFADKMKAALDAKAEGFGFKQADIVTGAKVYHNQTNIYRLTPEQIADLDRRITARVEKMKAAQGGEGTRKEAAAAGDTKAQAARNLKRA